MVFGETPYAEGFGDIKDLNFSKQNISGSLVKIDGHISFDM